MKFCCKNKYFSETTKNANDYDKDFYPTQVISTTKPAYNQAIVFWILSTSNHPEQEV